MSSPSPRACPHLSQRLPHATPAAGYLPCQGGYSSCDMPGKAATCPSLHAMVKLAGQAWKAANGVRAAAVAVRENAMAAGAAGAPGAGSRHRQPRRVPMLMRSTKPMLLTEVCLRAWLCRARSLTTCTAPGCPASRGAWARWGEPAAAGCCRHLGSAPSRSRLPSGRLRRHQQAADSCCTGPSPAHSTGPCLAGQDVRCCPAAQHNPGHPGQGGRAGGMGGCGVGVWWPSTAWTACQATGKPPAALPLETRASGGCPLPLLAGAVQARLQLDQGAALQRRPHGLAPLARHSKVRPGLRSSAGAAWQAHASCPT